MAQRTGVWAAFVLAFAGLGWLLMAQTAAEPKDLITLGAVAVACLAWFQSRKSANAATKNAALAQLSEERSRYGWTITLHPNGDHYVLRNTGTLAAFDVRFGNTEDFLEMRFIRHDGDEGPLILSGQAKAFYALEDWSSLGTEVLIEWRPEGEEERRTFNEVLPPMPSRVAEAERKKRSDLAAERADESATKERVVTETRRLLIELADVWGVYQADASAHNKMRVQGLVAALPGNFAKEIGYAVDVPRDFWGPDQWPLENFVQPRDRKLVRENAAMIELIWNLLQVQLAEVVEADNSQSPRQWYRIEHAVNGYVDLVRRRESKDRELFESPRDRKHRQEAKAQLAEFHQRFAKEPLPQPETEGDGDR